MPYFVYILKSVSSDKSYIGSTNNLEKRLTEHNNGTSLYTRGKGLWALVFSEQYKTRSEAVRRERYFKTVGGRIVNYGSSTPIVGVTPCLYNRDQGLGKAKKKRVKTTLFFN